VVLIPITASLRNKPLVMSTHHQRLVPSSPTVCEPAVMSPPITVGFTTGGDAPHHHRLKSNAPQTGGDSHFEPAVMGGAVVVKDLFLGGKEEGGSQLPAL